MQGTNCRKKNGCIREAIDSSTSIITAKEQEFLNRTIMLFKRADSQAANQIERLKADFDFINDFVKEGLNIQTTAN